MIKVTAVNYIKEDCLDSFLAIAKELVEKTNALDKGCIRYELCKDVNNPLRFVMIEEWESQSLLDEHMKASHFTQLVPKLGGFASQPSELTIMEKVF